MAAKLKALKKGDRVTIRFHTDVERHRSEALQVLPAKPGGGLSVNSNMHAKA
jgi:hypothetical protein